MFECKGWCLTHPEQLSQDSGSLCCSCREGLLRTLGPGPQFEEASSVSLKQSSKLVDGSASAFFSISLAALDGHLESSPSLYDGQGPWAPQGHRLYRGSAGCCLAGGPLASQGAGPPVKLQVPLLLQGELVGFLRTRLLLLLPSHFSRV